MGYRNVLIATLGDVVQHASKAHALVSRAEFPTDTDVSDFLSLCARGLTDLGSAVGVMVDACPHIAPIDERALVMRAIKTAAAGDPLNIGSDPEMMIGCVTAAFEHYRQAVGDPDTTLRFTESRDQWLKTVVEFATWERFSPMTRYCFLAEWLAGEVMSRGGKAQVFDADVDAVRERLAALETMLYGPEQRAVEAFSECFPFKR